MLSNNWFSAYRFTESHGIKMPGIASVPHQAKKYINKEILGLTLAALKNQYEGKSGDEFILKCFDVHHLIYNALWDAKVPCYFTLGWVSHNGDNLFFHSKSDLDSWLKTGIPNRDDVGLHCWITFPSGEIVDATISSVVAIRNNHPDKIGEITWAKSEEVNGFQYTPTMIGCEALRALGLSS